jgi:rubrerythrin
MQGLFRCRICGEVYFGSHPTHCPYCGAHGRYLVNIKDWTDENSGVVPTQTERENLETTKQLEYENTRFYRAAGKSAKTEELRAYFKYLAKIENEHYNVACKLLGADKDPLIFDPSEDKGSDLENLKYSKDKENHASNLYKEFIPRCESQRLQDFFAALSEVEADHITLDDSEISELKESV